MDYANNRRDVILRLPELYFWFSGLATNTMFTTSAGTTVSSDGVNIGLWRSVVGNCELSQSTAGNRPVLVQNLDSRELGVQFDTSSKRLVGNAAMRSFLNGAVAATVVSVVTLPTASVTKRMFQFSRNSADSSKMCSLLVDPNAFQLQSRRADADSIYFTNTVATYSAGVQYIRIDSVDPSTGLNKIQLYDPVGGLQTIVSQTASWTPGATF